MLQMTLNARGQKIGTTKRFISFAALLLPSYAAKCGIPPQVIPYGYINVSIPGIPIPVPRPGFPVQVGSPPQNLSLQVSSTLNVTAVGSTYGCSRFADYGLASYGACAYIAGGLFNSDNSTTWDIMRSYHRDDQIMGRIAASNGSLGEDRIAIAETDIAIDNMPLAILDTSIGDIFPGVLGLGSGSDFLDNLYALSKIPSKSFALQSEYLLQNGSLVLGGYDKTRFEGPLFNTSMEPVLDQDGEQYGRLQADVEDVILNFPDGRTQSLLDSESPQNSRQTFPASIDTGFPAIIFPSEITANFMRLTGAQRISSRQDTIIGTVQVSPQLELDLLEFSEPFLGSMTIVLTNGYNTTLPSTLLNIPYNSTTGNVYISPLAAATPRRPCLGTPFLNETYVIVDYETNRLSLAKSAYNNAAPELVTLGCDTENIANVQGENDQEQNGNSVTLAEKLGYTFGALGGAAVVLAAVLLVLRRRKKIKAAVAKTEVMKGLVEMDPTPATPHEIDTRSRIPEVVEVEG